MEFNILCEMAYQRYQQGGFLIGDRVKFRDDWHKHSFFAQKGENFLDIVRGCTAKDFDLNLRIASLKSIYPTTTQNYRGGTESPDCIFVDLVIEYAPGLYRTPITVPIEVLVLQDDGINTGPVPDSVRRKNNVHKPESVKTVSVDVEVNLNNKNVQLPNANQHNDSKPSTGWSPLPTK